MISSFLIHLGQNFWREKEGDKGPLGQWSDTMVTEDESWKRVTDYIAAQGLNTLLIDIGEGVKYDSHPELACEGAWSKQKTRDELERLRSIGLEPIPKLNFSTCHDAWLRQYGHMVSTDTYYRVLTDLIDETCELFDKPRLFHIGMDEEWPFVFNYQKANGTMILRQGDLYWHDVDFMLACCEKNGSRPWIWADNTWQHGEEVYARLSKDAVVSNATYIQFYDQEHLSSWEKDSFMPYYKMAELGFDQIPTCATYYGTQNPDETVRLIKDLPGVMGFLTAPWFRTRKSDELKLMAEAQIFGEAIRRHIPEEKR